MFENHIFECVDHIYDDIILNGSDELKDIIRQFEDVAGDESPYFLKKGIMLAMTLCLNQLQFQDELFEGVLQEYLEHMMEAIPEMKKTVICRIVVRELEKYIHRQVRIPYHMPLDELAYYILTMFQAEGTHLFTFITDQGKFGCDQCDEEMLDDYASDVFLDELDLKKGDTFSLWYDFGDDYIFDIQIQDIEQHPNVQTLHDIEIMAGEGFGIWEDEHSLLDMYYHDRQAFVEHIQDLGLNLDDFIFEEFDVNTANGALFDDYEFLKHAYMYDEYEM